MTDSPFRDSIGRLQTAARAAVGARPATVRRSATAMAAVRSMDPGAITGVHTREVAPVGGVAFVLRAHVAGGVRFAPEAELALARELRFATEGALRGAFAIAGPPAHTLLDLFFPDLAAAAGELWRAVKHVPEPGTAMDFTVEGDGLVVSVEHVERALLVSAAMADGRVHARQASDPFAFIDGVVGTCERLDRFFRAQGLVEASQSMYRHFVRPAFPRCATSQPG